MTCLFLQYLFVLSKILTTLKTYVHNYLPCLMDIMIFDPFFLTLSLTEGVNKVIILALGWDINSLKVIIGHIF